MALSPNQLAAIREKDKQKGAPTPMPNVVAGPPKPMGVPPTLQTQPNKDPYATIRGYLKTRKPNV